MGLKGKFGRLESFAVSYSDWSGRSPKICSSHSFLLEIQGDNLSFFRNFHETFL